MKRTSRKLEILPEEPVCHDQSCIWSENNICDNCEYYYSDGKNLPGFVEGENIVIIGSKKVKDKLENLLKRKNNPMLEWLEGSPQNCQHRFDPD